MENEILFELRDYATGDSCGIIRVTEVDKNNNPEQEIEESWTEFNKVEEHELDSYSVDDFVEWHNHNRVTQIERLFVTIFQPE
jgi:hypothetical protein